jgi:hypothetical protein
MDIIIALLFGFSIILNIITLTALYRRNKGPNPYEGLQDMLRDDSWGRIDSLDDAQSTGFCVNVLGKREKFDRR